MGTNYYYHMNVCPHCKRADKPIHIGKSSAGWTFSFRGYRKDYEDRKITSYAEWLTFLTSNIGEIRDEYGETISLEDFKKMVEAKRSAKYNHTTYCLAATHPGDRQHALESCWLDSEGNSFSESEFS